MTPPMRRAASWARCKQQRLRRNIQEIADWPVLECHHLHRADEWEPWIDDEGQTVYPSKEEAEYTAPLAFAIAVSVFSGGRRAMDSQSYRSCAGLDPRFQGMEHGTVGYQLGVASDTRRVAQSYACQMLRGELPPTGQEPFSRDSICGSWSSFPSAQSLSGHRRMSRGTIVQCQTGSPNTLSTS